jgi:hypothetical protein
MKKDKEEKFVDMKLHLDPEADKLLHEGAARAGVLPEDLVRSILITELAKPEKKTPIPNLSLLLFDRRVQELMVHTMLGMSDQLLRDIENYENRMKHYGQEPEWSGKSVILETAKRMQLLARIVPGLCKALDKANTLGGLLKWTIDVEREER